MAKKRKKKRSHHTILSPKKYIMSKARKLPFFECWINNNWQELGIATVLVARLQPSGKVIVAGYLVDIYCLGVKDALTRFSMSVDEFREFVFSFCERMGAEAEECTPAFAQNLVYGAVEYAEDLGFKPHKDYDFTRYILDPADEIEYIDIEFGKNGKPFLVRGPFDDFERNIAILNRTVGEGNYHFMTHIGDMEDGVFE